MRSWGGVIAFSLGVQAVPVAPAAAQTAAPVASSAQAQAHVSACDELAAAVLNDAQLEGDVDRLVEATISTLFAGNGDLKDLEAAYPGLQDAVGAGMKPVAMNHVATVLPAYRADLSGFYCANLTTQEARSANAFFRSPPFATFTASLRHNMDYKATVGTLLAEKDVSASDIRADLGRAGVKSAAELSRQDQAAIAAFMGSPLGIKLRALGPQKLAIEAKWTNYTDPAIERDIERAVEHAMISHIALTDPETAELLREELAKGQP